MYNISHYQKKCLQNQVYPPAFLNISNLFLAEPQNFLKDLHPLFQRNLLPLSFRPSVVEGLTRKTLFMEWPHKNRNRLQEVNCEEKKSGSCKRNHLIASSVDCFCLKVTIFFKEFFTAWTAGVIFSPGFGLGFGSPISPQPLNFSIA